MESMSMRAARELREREVSEQKLIHLAIRTLENLNELICLYNNELKKEIKD